MYYNSKDPIVIMNCRQDRVDRTEIFVRNVFPNIETHTLIGIGEVTEPITTAFKNGELPNVKNYIDLENASPDEILEVISPLMKNRDIYGVGNIHVTGEPFIERLLIMSQDKTKTDYSETKEAII